MNPNAKFQLQMEKYLPRILPSVIDDDIALVEEDG